MDRLLKDRKMASASARRKRIQQRNEQLNDQKQDRNPRRRRRFSEHSSSADESSRSASPDNDDSALETPSEYSARTPDNLSSPEVDLNSQTTADPTTATPESALEEDSKMTEMDQVSARSTLRADWSKRLDSRSNKTNFPYYRFSTLIPDSDFTDEEDEPTPVIRQDSESDYTEDEDEEPFTPIETATSVAYSLPTKKPSLISIASTQCQPSQHRSARSVNLLQPVDRPAPLRLQKSVDGFLAHEAKPIDLSSASLTARARNVSDAPSIETTSSKQEDNESTLRRKSSMPMLGKFAHARMNSLKNFIKPATSPNMPDVPNIPSRHQHRPSTAVKDQPQTPPLAQSMTYSHSASSRHLPIEPRRSLTEPTLTTLQASQSRPQTARMPSHREITALPRTESPPQEPQLLMEQLENPALARKKSFSSLRRRSGSIGSALKLAPNKTKPVPQESPPPPVPTIVAIPRETAGISKMPLPPAKSPRMSRGGGYSPFPRTTKAGEPVGLGLRV